MKKTILTVDDSKSIRQSTRFFLEEEGYDVLEADNGKQAIYLLNENKVDLIITDINMPELNGMDLVKKIRTSYSTYKYKPIIILTTDSKNEKKEMAKDIGATAWITKPFMPKTMLGIIKKII